jgi:hypothetical protein
MHLRPLFGHRVNLNWMRASAAARAQRPRCPSSLCDGTAERVIENTVAAAAAARALRPTRMVESTRRRRGTRVSGCSRIALPRFSPAACGNRRSAY